MPAYSTRQHSDMIRGYDNNLIPQIQKALQKIPCMCYNSTRCIAVLELYSVVRILPYLALGSCNSPRWYTSTPIVLDFNLLKAFVILSLLILKDNYFRYYLIHNLSTFHKMLHYHPLNLPGIGYGYIRDILLT